MAYEPPMDELVPAGELAATLARRNDKERARELMSQARNLLANRPRNYAQIKARLKVACAFAAVDADQSFEMIGAIVNQLDELAAATLVVGALAIPAPSQASFGGGCCPRTSVPPAAHRTSKPAKA